MMLAYNGRFSVLAIALAMISPLIVSMDGARLMHDFAEIFDF